MQIADSPGNGVEDEAFEVRNVTDRRDLTD